MGVARCAVGLHLCGLQPAFISCGPSSFRAPRAWFTLVCRHVWLELRLFLPPLSHLSPLSFNSIHFLLPRVQPLTKLNQCPCTAATLQGDACPRLPSPRGRFTVLGSPRLQ
eukprot:GGOE01010869.1.p8 GENE.GGOE01010869.1~~GGOE01010869.1.p8  ORF type:complete len:111 (-),score=7.66 GGOE01010869.1:2042-2374(-)